MNFSGKISDSELLRFIAGMAIPGSNLPGNWKSAFPGLVTKQIKLLKLALFGFERAGLKAGAFEHLNRDRLLTLANAAHTKAIKLFR